MIQDETVAWFQCTLGKRVLSGHQSNRHVSTGIRHLKYRKTSINLMYLCSTRAIFIFTWFKSSGYLIEFGHLPVGGISLDIIRHSFRQVWFFSKNLPEDNLIMRLVNLLSILKLKLSVFLTSNIFSRSTPSSHTYTRARPLRSLSRMPFASWVAFSFSKRLLFEPHHW